MVSRLLTSIDAKLKSTSNPLTRMTLLAERAGVLARLGQSDVARKQLDELRAANSGYDAAVTCRILIGEGLLAHYEYELERARDRFRRAYAISAAVGETRLKALSAAWLGVNEFQFDNLGAAAERTAEAIRDADPMDHNTLARAHLVAADLFNSAGDSISASRLYKIARQHAVEEGDLSMQSLVLYNFAAFRAHQLSLDHANGKSTDEQASLAEKDVSSIGTLDQGIGNRSLARMVPLLHGQVLTIQGRWGEALAKFDDHIEFALSEGLEREVPKALTCRALCYRAVGRNDREQADFRSTIEHLHHCADLDDLAIVHHRLHLLTRDESPEQAEEYLASFERCMVAFEARQRADLVVIRQSLSHLI